VVSLVTFVVSAAAFFGLCISMACPNKSDPDKMR